MKHLHLLYHHVGNNVVSNVDVHVFSLGPFSIAAPHAFYTHFPLMW